MREKKRREQGLESVELNEDQLDAASGGYVAQNGAGHWFVVTDKGHISSCSFNTKKQAQIAAAMVFRSTEEISWADVWRRKSENR